jgi:hypothetical protein
MENPVPTDFKREYIVRIASGMTERQILRALNVPWILFFTMLAEDPQFRDDIEEAKKHRAELWVARVVDSLEEEIASAAVPAARLEFEKLKFLAGVDNPEKYGAAAKSAKVDVNVDFKQFQMLPAKEALRVLQSDPFNTTFTIGAKDGTTEGKQEQTNLEDRRRGDEQNLQRVPESGRTGEG